MSPHNTRRRTGALPQPGKCLTKRQAAIVAQSLGCTLHTTGRDSAETFQNPSHTTPPKAFPAGYKQFIAVSYTVDTSNSAPHGLGCPSLGTLDAIEALKSPLRLARLPSPPPHQPYTDSPHILRRAGLRGAYVTSLTTLVDLELTRVGSCLDDEQRSAALRSKSLFRALPPRPIELLPLARRRTRRRSR